MPKITEYSKGLHYKDSPDGQQKWLVMVNLDNGQSEALGDIVHDWVCAICHHGLREFENRVICPNCLSHEVIRLSSVSAIYQEQMQYVMSFPREVRSVVDAQIIKPHDPEWYWPDEIYEFVDYSGWEPLPAHLRK